eukprot:CAMPEP_0115832546 /NCGR_PEP_ID=MMETSP0287-20121206/2715_1 /TAXON_ID=412157 /ORGANISM="Chrysochromulina rotalis, Strain UIO044" /LENGTH=224 /DNA_ID=CAMNT_0003285937 /DNA_START=141 /DNA_END=815 /DNA_ORIENTATION=-
MASLDAHATAAARRVMAMWEVDSKNGTQKSVKSPVPCLKHATEKKLKFILGPRGLPEARLLVEALGSVCVAAPAPAFEEAIVDERSLPGPSRVAWPRADRMPTKGDRSRPNAALLLAMGSSLTSGARLGEMTGSPLDGILACASCARRSGAPQRRQERQQLPHPLLDPLSEVRSSSRTRTTSEEAVSTTLLGTWMGSIVRGSLRWFGVLVRIAEAVEERAMLSF